MAPTDGKTPVMTNEDQSAETGFSLDDVVGYRLKRAYMVINDDYKSDPNLERLTTREFTVLALVDAQDEVSQSDIARKLGIERSGMVKLIDGLEAKGYLERRPHPSDRRVYQLKLSCSGGECLRTHHEAVRSHEDRILDALSDDERASLLSLLRKVQHGA